MTVGCVAGDEETYDVFKELMDPVIEARHNGYKPTDKHKTDLNPANLKVLREKHYKTIVKGQRRRATVAVVVLSLSDPRHLGQGDIPLAEWFSAQGYYPEDWGSKPARALCALPHSGPITCAWSSPPQGGDNLDPNYVLSSRVRTGRSVRGYCLPPFCSRGERRAVEKLSVEGEGGHVIRRDALRRNSPLKVKDTVEHQDAHYSHAAYIVNKQCLKYSGLSRVGFATPANKGHGTTHTSSERHTHMYIHDMF